MNGDDKTMLALAALTYRGFGNHSEAAIEKALRPWLGKLDPEGLGKWELAWGPAAFRAPTSLFDDAMIYIARQKDRPAGAQPRYAVAIRGTNPVSAFDWVFGDFWVRLQVDWTAAGTPPARLSASTALGLAIGQHLTAEVPPSAAGGLAGFGKAVAGALSEFARALPEIDPIDLLEKPGAFTDARLMERIDTLTRHTGPPLQSQVLGRLFDRFGRQKDDAQLAMDRLVFDGLLRHIAAFRGPGETLIEFMNRAVEPNARVAVTGHSKGGALAIATALWLTESWAPYRRAEIECFSFAGPTAGNAAFAQRYNAQLAGRTRRIVNRRDIVPHAWVPGELRGVQTFYRVLGPAVKLLTDSVAPLGYTHVGGDVVEIASKKVKRGLIEEIVYQHLDAYLTDAAFHDPQWNARSIFLGD